MEARGGERLVLLDNAALTLRRRLAAGPFAALADSLADDLARLADGAAVYVPPNKARLTRDGGRCPGCNSALDFDPWSPTRHRCPHCNAYVTGSAHDGIWTMWYQLWLAERAVHAATLAALRGAPAHRSLAGRILRAYSEQYLAYPNRDNVLGPARVFFSTYLDSIWTLQLACAASLLEQAGVEPALGAELRERVLQPSAALIRTFDEGRSNRQVWNNAALLACGAMLGDNALTQLALHGPSGLLTHLEHGLLADGTWYEGENYHLFAQRGLWYGVTLARRAGLQLAPALGDRYARAFATPFLTALPDFTIPARRDSQYRVSLRQWRSAESCELGLAEAFSPVLAAALHELYRTDVPVGETGRDRSTAEAERNVAAARLTRADLGWKSLLFACAEVPEMPPDGDAAVRHSLVLPHQGFAVLRRAAGATYVALDYGESGGGHGHPDRLNLWLIVGNARILEDVGTGSYVVPSLHWYRSTLAHNAPLAQGQSQRRASGSLLAFDEQGDFGWVRAHADLAPGVSAERAVMAAADYLIDDLRWRCESPSTVDLPIHVSVAVPATWIRATIEGAGGLEDGFDHVTAAARSEVLTQASFTATVAGREARLWLYADEPFVLWRLTAPGPPNESERHFLLVRGRGMQGRLCIAFAWTPETSACMSDGPRLVIDRRNGSRHTHQLHSDTWRIRLAGPMVGRRAGGGGGGGGGRDIVLAGSVPARRSAAPAAEPSRGVAPPYLRIPRAGNVAPDPGAIALGSMPAFRRALGAESYRRSEQTWHEAGSPRAIVAIAATDDALHFDVAVAKHPLAFAPRRDSNPLDNEHPDVNSDGVQLYIAGASRGRGAVHSWILVPVPGSSSVRLTPRQEGTPELPAAWRAVPQGYAVRIVVPRTLLDERNTFLADLVVNESTPERERRRGQLVLSGSRDEWVYLRGDRQDATRLLPFEVADG
ncbi:MAG: heparinase II/III domain-containing protein [Gemmatimonadaceae bacterium]